MGYEDLEAGEKVVPQKSAMPKKMTLNQAVEFGEYDPNFLSTFPEWATYSRHIQFEYVKKALENRNRQLVSQWAEINNMLDFRLKPQLAEALENIQKQIKKLDEDKEHLFYEYSK
jgi:hypothetical protein